MTVSTGIKQAKAPEEKFDLVQPEFGSTGNRGREMPLREPEYLEEYVAHKRRADILYQGLTPKVRVPQQNHPAQGQSLGSIKLPPTLNHGQKQRSDWLQLHGG
nr:hypothetical protein [Tanacetum cinerariifolium]